MKIFVKNKPTDAWHWILNNGYVSAWKYKGYDTFLFDKLEDLKNQTDYNVMCFDDDINNFESLEILQKSNKSWVYVQPTYYPDKWGKNPLFTTSCNAHLRNQIEKNRNIKLWSFVTTYDNEPLFSGWNKVHNILLGFDDINYIKNITKPHVKYQYDVCYIGGRAHNGFDEKIKLLKEVFTEFEKSNLKTGFFINKGLSLAAEANILFHSGIGLNVHDVFQRLYGYDTNERTFKTLGLTGYLVSDAIKQLQEFFPSTPSDNDPKNLVKHVKSFFELTEKERNDIKETNRHIMLNQHTYKNRVESLLSL